MVAREFRGRFSMGAFGFANPAWYHLLADQYDKDNLRRRLRHPPHDEAVLREFNVRNQQPWIKRRGAWARNRLSGILVRGWLMKTAILLMCLAFAIGPQARPQDVVGDFTRSPYEHIINEIDQPFEVRSVKGLITLPYGGGPLAGVLLEIQGPGPSRQIRRSTTDQHGRFKMADVPEGTYRFKATLSAYQSEMGTIIVSKKAARGSEIKIQMPVGV